MFRRRAQPVFTWILAGVFTLSSCPHGSAAYRPDALPVPGTRINLTPAFRPALMTGIKINPAHPLSYEFFIDRGDTPESMTGLRRDADKLIKYFLTALTIPDDDLWVNLAPEEEDRIVPGNLGRTAMGRDLLEQDYLLKQLSASLLYPEQEPGKSFWQRLRARHPQAEDVSRDLIHKIWIVPRDAVVYEKGTEAYLVHSRLKVMLEDDYLQEIHSRVDGSDTPAATDAEHLRHSRALIKEVLIPEIEREVNHGRHFAPLRQIYNSMILAAWYKTNLKQGLLGQVYVDRQRTKGVDVADRETSRKIYDRYMHALRKGVYNYIREDIDPVSQTAVPRQYFSGGMVAVAPDQIRVIRHASEGLSQADNALLTQYAASTAPVYRVKTDLLEIGRGADAAVLSNDDAEGPQYTDRELRQLILGQHHRIFSPVMLDREWRNFRNELFVTGHLEDERLTARSQTVYDFIDGLPDKGFEGGVILGIRTWQGTYRQLADMSGLTPWEEAYRSLYGDASDRIEDFLEHITAQASARRPIVFLVPRDALTHPGRNAAARELEWFLAHPERTEHVKLVFGAYHMITPSDWHRSVLGAQHGLRSGQRRQAFSYFLRHHRAFRAEYLKEPDLGDDDLHARAAAIAVQSSFEEFLLEFKRTTAQALDHFRRRDWDGSLENARERLQLHDMVTYQTASAVSIILEERAQESEIWDRIRRQLADNYLTETDAYKLNLILSFLDEVRSQLTRTDLPDAEPDFTTALERLPGQSQVIRRHGVGKTRSVHDAFRDIIQESQLDGLFAHLMEDLSTASRILEDQIREIAEDVVVHSLEVIQPLFIRNKAAYIVGRVNTNHGVRPLVVALIHTQSGIVIDAVLANDKTAKNLLLSSTRSAFHVNSSDFREIIGFIHELYPDVSYAQIYDLLGFTQRSQQVYLGELRAELEEEGALQFIAAGPTSITFTSPGSPLVMKVIPDNTPRRSEIVRNYLNAHNTNRLGQMLDTWMYTNLRLPRDQIGPSLLRVLRERAEIDVEITDTHVVFRRVYAQRKVTPVEEYLAARPDKESQQDTLLKVGWNIKHLASMGILPTDMALRHFGVTSWGRVVYMNNAGIGRMDNTRFAKAPQYMRIEDAVITLAEDTGDGSRFLVYPELLPEMLDIPETYREVFEEVHGDLFDVAFWNSRHWRMRTDPLPDIYPYSNKYRVNTKRLELILSRMGLPEQAGDGRSLVSTPKLDVAEISMHGLNFLRLRVPNPRARILVVEPIGPDIIAMLHRQLGNVDFDVIQAESELVEEAEYWAPGLQGKLKDLVQANHYDYVLGYVNETFDQEFFDTANIKGLLLFSTGVHNIDIPAATANGIAVTNAPGPTTVAVAEQNIGLMLDSMYGNHVRSAATKGFSTLSEALRETPATAEGIAGILWYQLLRQSLKLDDMFAFASEGRYVRTGVGSYATVYHDQIGQNREAGIKTHIGIVGLDAVGERLIEMAIAHEASSILVLEEEYDRLPEEARARLQNMIRDIERHKRRHGVKIVLRPVTARELQELSTYSIATPGALADGLIDQFDSDYAFDVDTRRVHVKNGAPLTLAMRDVTVGIQGLGRIGQAVAQRVISMGARVLVNQRDFRRSTLSIAQAYLLHLAQHIHNLETSDPSYMQFVNRAQLVSFSDILTTLTPLTDETAAWIDQRQLKNFGTEAEGPVKIIVSQVKNIIDETALVSFLQVRPDVQVRLDVVAQEEKGDAHTRFRDTANRPLTNIKIAGHTAAAVPAVRRLKVHKALDNLAYLMDNKTPPNLLNPDVMRHKEEEIHLAGLKFRRLESVQPKAQVLVVEPLTRGIRESLQTDFPDVNFDILAGESEIVEQDGQMLAGIEAKLDEIVRMKDYDFCVGYCNARFDEPFFEAADLRALVLFATAEHHIDLEAATGQHTLVTTAPGPTTTAVAEQNIGLILDGIYGDKIYAEGRPGTRSLTEIPLTNKKDRIAAAEIMWFSLLRRVLKLEDMFAFGRKGRYAKTGVSVNSTVYHDQLGQNKEAGITTSVGILGLQTTGVHLLELAIAHEVDTIYVLKREFDKLGVSTQERIRELIQMIQTYSQSADVQIKLKLVDEDELRRESNYVLRTPAYPRKVLPHEADTPTTISADDIHLRPEEFGKETLAGLNLGVHGVRRIGTATAQRALGFGVNLLVDTDSLNVRDADSKIAGFWNIAQSRRAVFGKTLQDPQYVSKDDFLRHSHIITTLGDSSKAKNRHWVDATALGQFGQDAPGSVRVIVNASKYQVDEQALLEYARTNPTTQIRLDVLNEEAGGAAQRMFVDAEGENLANVKLSGHTAAAVWAVRRLKIVRALTNLRKLIDGEIPDHVLNPDVLKHVRSDEALTVQAGDEREVGGINLNPRLLDLQIKRDGGGIPLPVAGQPLDQIHIEGFLPVIIQIQPVINLPQLLGLTPSAVPALKTAAQQTQEPSQPPVAKIPALSYNLRD